MVFRQRTDEDSEGGSRPRSSGSRFGRSSFGGSNFGGRSSFRGNRDSGFGGRSSGGFGRERRPVEMHDAVCDKCKKDCQVPFRPSNDKPILCSECFSKREGGSSRGSSGVSPEQFKELNEKLDKILKILETK